jgi:hypothetical protein
VKITSKDIEALANAAQESGLTDASKELALAMSDCPLMVQELMVLALTKGGGLEETVRCLLSATCVGFEMGQAWAEKGQLEGMMGETDPRGEA